MARATRRNGCNIRIRGSSIKIMCSPSIPNSYYDRLVKFIHYEVYILTKYKYTSANIRFDIFISVYTVITIHYSYTCNLLLTFLKQFTMEMLNSLNNYIKVCLMAIINTWQHGEIPQN